MDGTTKQLDYGSRTDMQDTEQKEHEMIRFVFESHRKTLVSLKERLRRIIEIQQDPDAHSRMRNVLNEQKEKLKSLQSIVELEGSRENKELSSSLLEAGNILEAESQVIQELETSCFQQYCQRIQQLEMSCNHQYHQRVKMLQANDEMETKERSWRKEKLKDMIGSTQQRFEKMENVFQTQLSHTLRSEIFQRKQFQESLFQRIKTQEDKQLEEIRSAMKMETDLVSIFLSQQSINKDIRTELEKEEECLNSLWKRISDYEYLNQQSCGKRDVSRGNPEIAKLYQKIDDQRAELEDVRSHLTERTEELKSFKDRMAKEVAPSIKTGKAMSLNSPVSKKRINEMYDDLKNDWKAVKNVLKSKLDPDTAKRQIQKNFECAKTKMEEKKNEIRELLGFNQNSSAAPPEKIEQCTQLAIQGLQLALYYQRKNPDSQKADDFNEFLYKCYWHSCLMALSNPPLQPDWEKQPDVPSMSQWDILPNVLCNPYEKQQQDRICTSI